MVIAAIAIFVVYRRMKVKRANAKLSMPVPVEMMPPASSKAVPDETKEDNV